MDLAPEHLAEVRRILAAEVPDCEVRAFGSRVTGTARRFSDLDLAVVPPASLDPRRLDALRDAFAASDLPVRVDVLDWRTLSPAFRGLIEARYEVVQTGT